MTAKAGNPGGGVMWDTSQLQTFECNVASATSTPKEVILSFGFRRGDGRPGTELQVELLNRVVLAPVAASRLRQLLTRLVSEHESSSNER